MADASRARRLGVRIQQIIAESLGKVVKNPRVRGVTITDARLTPDLRDATIYFTVLGTEEEATVAERALESAKGVLRSEVGARTGVKFTPTLTFVRDKVPEHAQNIEELLARAREADQAVSEQASTAQHAGESNPYRETSVDDD